jgi:hypothetical protein
MPFSLPVLIALPFILAAAPGERPATLSDAPLIAWQAVERRLGADRPLRFGAVNVRTSQRTPGYVVCGEVVLRNGGAERFFVVVPGSFAVLERDGADLVTNYWRLNGC